MVDSRLVREVGWGRVGFPSLDWDALPFRLPLGLWPALFLTSALDMGRKPWLCCRKRKPLSSMPAAKPGCTEKMYPEAFHKAIM